MNLHDIIIENKPQLIGVLVGAITMTTLLAVFVGRKHFTWLIKELVKMYSAGQKSWFSKKRIESGVSFIIAQHGMLFWLAKKYTEMNTTDFCMWATLEFAIAGWTVSQIQREKVQNSTGAVNDNNDGK